MIFFRKNFGINKLTNDHFKDIKCSLDYFSIMVEGSYWGDYTKIHMS